MDSGLPLVRLAQRSRVYSPWASGPLRHENGDWRFDWIEINSTPLVFRPSIVRCIRKVAVSFRRMLCPSPLGVALIFIKDRKTAFVEGGHPLTVCSGSFRNSFSSRCRLVHSIYSTQTTSTRHSAGLQSSNLMQSLPRRWGLRRIVLSKTFFNTLGSETLLKCVETFWVIHCSNSSCLV